MQYTQLGGGFETLQQQVFIYLSLAFSYIYTGLIGKSTSWIIHLLMLPWLLKADEY